MIKKYISRPIYIDKIKPFIDKDAIKVIVGQRRMGKSYFLYPKIVISTDEMIKEKGYKEVKHINIKDFLLRGF